MKKENKIKIMNLFFIISEFGCSCTFFNHYAGAGQGRLRGLDRSPGGGGCVLGVGWGAGWNPRL